MGIVRALVPGYCGLACLASRVRIEIVDTKQKFPSDALFAYAYCVQREDLAEYCDKRVSFVANKIYAGKEPCGITDSFDSGDVPRYVIHNFHEDVVIVEEDGESDV